MEYRDFLLEINTEELPTGYIKDACAHLEDALRKELLLSGILMDKSIEGFAKTIATKNSLVVYIKDLAVKQKAREEEIIGPPKRIAFDENGNPTKPAIGFAKKLGVEIADLKVKSTSKGEYIVVKKIKEARDTRDLLKDITPAIIKDTPFPKTMKWDDSGLRFARPIESVLMLFGKENIEIELGKVPQKKINPIAPGKYLKQLGEMVDCEVRKKKIRKLILAAIKKLKADQYVNEDLLSEVNFMVNSPEVFIGEFDKKFLDVPDDVLKASMSKHQRVFPVSKNGKLINRFIAVIDGKKRKNNKVRRNYERILEAKLKDSLFFFKEDTKKQLSENIFQLKDLIFQKDLGNMFEKIQRLKGLCTFLCDKIGAGSSLKNDTLRAAEISKADLLTYMVGEFPSLQGIMGGEYALRSGEKETVAMAVKEHYLPQGSGDDLPGTEAGAILSISDKIDNVVGFCGMGMERISGSFDPFGIRRNALGFIQIVRNKKFRFDVEDLIQKAIELYGNKLNISERFKSQVVDYIKDRVEFLMGDVKPIELKKAILGTRCFDIADVSKRFEDIVSIKEEAYFLQAAKVVERTSNILKGAKGEQVDKVAEDLFKEDLERRVWDAYLNSKDKIQSLINQKQYKDATEEYARVFYGILHEFFDKVLVNVDDRALRLNRLAMMKAINRLYVERVADLALLPQIVVK